MTWHVIDYMQYAVDYSGRFVQGNDGFVKYRELLDPTSKVVIESRQKEVFVDAKEYSVWDRVHE